MTVYMKVGHSLKVVKKAKEFSFSEKYIFGRFDSFCMRLKNLLKMFSTINQFTSLFNSRTEVCDRNKGCFAKSFKRNVCRSANWMQQSFAE